MAIDNKFANTRAVSIGELLSQRRTLKVPRFQRNYDWDEERVGALWDDMMDNFCLVRDRSDQVPEAQYLLGPVVLVSNQDKNEFFVIDGQQRLSTLTMLFCVARDIMHEYQTKDGIDKIDNLLANRNMSKHIGWKLELNDTDKDLFREIQEYEHGEDPQIERFGDKKFKTKSEKMLAGNYKFLHKKLLESLDNNFDPNNPHREHDDENARNERRKTNMPMMSYFVDFVCEYNYVVMVMVSDDNTAFQIFETLNERGKTLAKSNLIKNHILNQSKEPSMQKEQSDRWNRIFDEVVGTNQRDDDFIMESYNSRNGDSGSIRSKSRETLPMSTKNLYKIVKNMVNDKTSCKRLIDELDEDAEFLAMLNDPSIYSDEDTKDDVRAIRALKAKFIRTAWLAAYRKWYHKNPKDYSELVRFLVKFFFKIRVVRQVHPGRIERIADSAVRLINNGKPLQEVIAELKRHDNHEDFIYNFEKKFIQDPQKDAAKYALQQITIHLGTRYDDVRPIDGLTLEHILPQKHDPKEWDESAFFAGYDKDARIDEFKDRLGNLTLLQKAVSAQNKNYSFQQKKDHKMDGNQVGYLGSKLEINRQTVCNHDEWTASIIEQREKDFVSYADKIWNLD